MQDIISPAQAQTPNVMISYMDPVRHKDDSWEFDVTIHSIEGQPQRVVNCQFRVLNREFGIALADAIKQVVMKEISPTLHKPNGN
jgi:hypothetical protein